MSYFGKPFQKLFDYPNKINFNYLIMSAAPPVPPCGAEVRIFPTLLLIYQFEEESFSFSVQYMLCLKWNSFF